MDNRKMATANSTRPRNPEATRKRILHAATKVFARNGFDGARVDVIAQHSKINKQLLYHHFGNKDQLFTAVLENAYRNFRQQEASLDLSGLRADACVMKLIEFTWAYYIRNPEFIRLLNSENQLEARHLKASPNTREINASHVALLKRIVAQGKREKSLRADLDPVELSINIASLGFFYLINRFTLSTVFRRNLGSSRNLNARLAGMKDAIARWIAP